MLKLNVLSLERKERNAKSKKTHTNEIKFLNGERKKSETKPTK